MWKTPLSMGPLLKQGYIPSCILGFMYYCLVYINAWVKKLYNENTLYVGEIYREYTPRTKNLRALVRYYNALKMGLGTMSF